MRHECTMGGGVALKGLCFASAAANSLHLRISMKNRIKILMTALFPIFIAIGVQANCVSPTSQQLRQFFNGQSQWTEVNSHTSHNIAERNPVFINLNFSNPAASTVRWGSNSGGRIEALCRINGSSLQIVTRHRLAGRVQFTLTRHAGGLISSQSNFPGIGQYFYRPNSQVIRPERLSEVPREEVSEGEAVAI